QIGTLAGTVSSSPVGPVGPVSPVTPEGATWDGTYPLQVASQKCSGPGTDALGSQIQSALSGNIVVSNNTIPGGPFGDITIDSAGQAKSTYTYDAGGGVSAAEDITFMFT